MGFRATKAAIEYQIINCPALVLRHAFSNLMATRFATSLHNRAVETRRQVPEPLNVAVY